MKKSNKIIGSVVLASFLALGATGCGGGGGDSAPVAQSPTQNTSSISDAQKNEVLKTYADIAIANYSDALGDAKLLQTALKTFTTTANEANFSAAKKAWLQSRESYSMTEIFRLSNGPIDSEDEGFMQTWGAPEGQLNAWPLDENMIDYTRAADGAITSGNIIDTAGNFTPSNGSVVDVTSISKEVLSDLNENGGDANVATGYHAIEFLLWGQDQDYNDFLADTVTNGALVAGMRPLTDFTSAANADRRKAYLNAAADLVVEDLEKMVDAWKKETGTYREAFLGKGAHSISAKIALQQVFVGMGMFIKSELANERMAVAILTPSEEDEHSCFSDNTHRDIAQNYVGFKNIIKGEYKGSAKGTSFYSLLTPANKALLDSKLVEIDKNIKIMNDAATSPTGEHFDYQIKDGSSYKQNLKDARSNLRELGNFMVNVASNFGVSLNEDDMTDPDENLDYK